MSRAAAPHRSGGRPRLRSVLIVAALLWALTAVAVHGGSLSADHHRSDIAVPVATSWGSAAAVVDRDAAHLVDGSASSHVPEQVTTAVLPRPATGFAALGLGVAVLAVVGGCCWRVVCAGRGPPWVPALVVSGRGLLTLFCTARR